MKKVFLLGLLLYSCLLAQQNYYSSSMGDAGISSLSLENGFLLNPAGVVKPRSITFYFNHHWLYEGVGEYSVGISAPIYRSLKGGVAWSCYGNQIYRQRNLTAGLGYSLSLMGELELSLGVSTEYFAVNYYPEHGSYVVGRDEPNDPLFQDERGRHSYFANAGVNLCWRERVHWGLVARRINGDYPALSSGEGYSIQELGTGISYQLSFGTVSLDYVFSPYGKDGLRAGLELTDFWDNLS